MEKPTVIPEKIHFKDIVPLKETLDNQYDLVGEELIIAVAQATKHSLQKNIFKISISVILKCSEKIVLDYLYEFTYEVENMKEFLSTDQERPVFTGQLIGTLLSISYSTMRGILYSKLADTQLRSVILPVINPNDLLKSKIPQYKS